MFGAFYLPKTWPEAYGATTPAPEDLIGQLFDPLGPRPSAPTAPAETPSA